MFRWMMVFFLLWMTAVSALADSTLYTIASETATNLYYVCEDFTQDLPPELAQALSARLRAQDELICGAMRTAYHRSNEQEPKDVSALAAVRRGGKILLFAVCCEEGIWNAAIETDSFLDENQPFSITVVPRMNADEEVTDADLALKVNGEEFRLFIRPEATVELMQYRYETAEGTLFELDITEGFFSARVYREKILLQRADVSGLIPRRMCAWTYRDFPANIAQIKAYAALNPARLGQDEAVIFGVNFREQATTKSRSMGKYTARAHVIDGDKQPAWYHVAVGDTTGWVSGTYTATEERETWKGQICGNLSQVLKTARTERETVLASSPGGSGKMMLPAGMLLHVISENEGWLHVILPRERLTWKTDWDGTYGYIQRDAAETGVSEADARWK